MSMLGQRGVFGVTLDKLAAENDRILALSADLRNSSGLDRFFANHPARFINTGVAEQNMVGIAAALADSGYIVFASTFSNFAALRACEFVRHFMGYMGSPVKLVGLSAGFGTGFLGYTHYGIEDISALRSISNLTIISPSDGLETAKTVTALIDYDAPVYLRLTGAANMPIVYKSDYDFHVGKAILLKDGNDVALVACGSMVANALEAAMILESEGIGCAVVNIHTIKPMDTDAIEGLFGKKIIVSIEEHNTIGGLGSAIADHLSERRNAPVLLKLGVLQGYAKAGGYRYMLEQNGLLPQQIARKVASALADN